MTLRTKLTIAFFAISVVPLSAVTFVSYLSSERALRRAAEQQADGLANELTGRMEWVKADLQRRMGRAWPLPVAAGQFGGERLPDRRLAGGPSGAVSADQVAGYLTGVLNEMAPVVDKLEFVPPRASGMMSGGTRSPLPPPGLPRGGVRGADPRRGVASDASAALAAGQAAAEISRALSEAIRKYQSEKTAVDQAQVAAWTRRLQEEIRVGLTQLPRSGEPSFVPWPGPGPAPEAAAPGTGGPDQGRTGIVTVMKGDALHTEVRQDGRTIGEINARINTGRLLRAVLGMTRRDRQEIPFAVDAEGHLHAPRTSDQGTVESLQLTKGLPASGTATRSVNDWVVATRRDASGVTFGIARPLGSELRDLRRVSLQNFAGGFGLIALVFVGSIPLAGSMTRNLRTLMDGVHRLSAGDLSARVSVKSRDEFGRLGAAFNQMAENVAAHERLVVEQERIRRELELCRQIQNEMLPRQPLRLGLAEVKGLSIPAREVGGDFFNYFVLPQGSVALLVGDVSGKGVGAALLMANVQATLRARLPLEQDLARLADSLDRDLQQNTPPEVYLTLFLGIMDTERRVLRYINAGHQPQFVLRAGGGFERLSSTGRPLGLLAGAGYEELTLPLEEGDVLLFYTDGMVEAENEEGEFLGADRLEAALTSSPRTDVDTILVHVEDVVRRFRGRAEPSDDATIMALRFGVHGSSPTLA
jgi:serine phosphatase RsbU (regulator of sigma subunit)